MRSILGLGLFVGLFLAAFALLMPSAESTPVFRFGRVYGPTAVGGHHCVLTDIYTADVGHNAVVWYVLSTRSATYTLYRHDIAGVDNAQGSNVTVTANTESSVVSSTPLRQSRLNVCNTASSTGTITIDADERM